MLYLYWELNSSSVFPLKDWRQKIIHSSSERPIPFRKRVYCSRPKCFRWWFLRRFVCKLRMQSGKCWDSESMELAVMAVPSTCPSPSEYTDSALPKFLDRWFKIGVKRSSSSNRGRARLVNYERLARSSQQKQLQFLSPWLTSSDRSSRAVNSAIIMLSCSLPGT